jgi:hypothetical protein
MTDIFWIIFVKSNEIETKFCWRMDKRDLFLHMSSLDRVRIFYVDGKTEDRSMTSKTFTEKFLNELLQSHFTVFEGPDETHIFISQNENETNDTDEKRLNRKASEIWRKAGHKGNLYGTVVQIPENELYVALFNRMQILEIG